MRCYIVSMLLLLPVSVAFAGNATVGGAIDLVAGVQVAPGVAAGALGLQQAEGDVHWGSESFWFDAQIDAAATFSGEGVFIYSLAPERLALGGGGRSWRAWGGIFPGFFRMESVDPWRSQFVRPALATARVPGAILGAGAEFGGPKAGVSLLVGAQPSTVDLFQIDDGPVSLPFVAGARGRVTLSAVEVAGGAWFGGGLDSLGFGGLELGTAVDLGVVVPYGEFVSDLRQGHAGFVGADLFPDGVVSPGARVELDAVRGFGVSVGAASSLFDILRIKAEASYQAGAPGVYLEVALHSKEPVDDDRFGRSPRPAPARTPRPPPDKARAR